ncbi:MAG: hypothetical protein V3T81_05380 [Thermoanaerobaculia bacterium]
MPTYQDLRAKADEAWQPFAEPQRTLIKVGVTTCSGVVGARETLDAIRSEVASRGPSTGSGQALEADVMVTGCWGLCYAEPIVEVVRPGRPGVLYGNLTADKVPQLIEQAVAGDGVASELALAVNGEEAMRGVPPLSASGGLEFFAGQERRLMANCGVTDPEEIDHYIARGGYEGLAKALDMTDEQVIAEVLESGLWGRGGAAFPTGRKWDFLRGAQATPKYMICNADEGDPGSFVNRNLMESDPHLVIEGMIIGGWATGASYGYIYIRDEYPLPVERTERAIEQARGRGLLGDSVLGSGLAFDLEVVRGAGSYVCGEETGLIA